MHITFIMANGQKFDSALHEGTREEFEDAREKVYEHLEDGLNRFRMLLPDGSHLFVGEKAIRDGVLIFHD